MKINAAFKQKEDPPKYYHLKTKRLWKQCVVEIVQLKSVLQRTTPARQLLYLIARRDKWQYLHVHRSKRICHSSKNNAKLSCSQLPQLDLLQTLWLQHRSDTTWGIKIKRVKRGSKVQSFGKTRTMRSSANQTIPLVFIKPFAICETHAGGNKVKCQIYFPRLGWAWYSFLGTLPSAWTRRNKLWLVTVSKYYFVDVRALFKTFAD